MKGAILVSAAVSSLVSIIGTVVALNVLAPAIVEAQETRIRAESVVVVDGNGTNRVRMATGPDVRSQVTVLSQAGIPRVSIGAGGFGRGGVVLPDEANLEVYAPEGPTSQPGGLRPIAVLGTTQDGAGSHMLLSDRQGQIRIGLRVDADGNPSIQMLDANGNVAWSAQ